MASLPVKIATAVDADKLAVGEIVVNSTNGEVWTKTSAGEVKKVGSDDAYLLNRANHTGTQPMSSIGDKQGKVLDDLTVIKDVFAGIDDLKTPGGYVVEVNQSVNGYFGAATILVAEAPVVDDGEVIGVVTSQTAMIPEYSKVGMRHWIGTDWSEWKFSLIQDDFKSWYNSTTTEAANAVINSDGTLSRSLVSHNPNQLLEVSGASRAFIMADVNKYARYTSTGAKTATFDSGEGFAAGDAFHITNRAASGNITISGTGITFNAPKGGTLVLEPGDTVTVKFISTTEADVMGSTGAA